MEALPQTSAKGTMSLWNPIGETSLAGVSVIIMDIPWVGVQGATPPCVVTPGNYLKGLGAAKSAGFAEGWSLAARCAAPVLPSSVMAPPCHLPPGEGLGAAEYRENL